GSMEMLADRDPEEARQLLDPVLERLMAAVHRYEGTVNQVLGDGIMALFGAPPGVLSAVYGFALEAGEPIADVASAHGAGVWRGNVVYIFSNSGAFLTTAIYCLWLHARHKTLGELVVLPAGPEEARLSLNWAWALVTGVFWYGQFFFYNLGHVRMGHYKFTSWAIHMIMLVLFSNAVGIALREWRQCRRVTYGTLGAALAVLVGAVLLLTYGNYIGDLATQ
ncbi:MAG: hypothetical protein HYV26_06545, partial [Candidatus Hydrogenedentes bacterium]|nr:hypothetical protein [Candidatus Hydrogenedentota bacterium]